MNRHLWTLAVLQGLFLMNNVTLIAIHGLVGAGPCWLALRERSRAATA